MADKNYHFAELIHRRAEKYGQRAALSYRDRATEKWVKISWIQFAKSVRLASQAMVEYGIGEQENIGIYSQNMPQCFFTCFGAYGIRAVEVPIFPTSSPEQVKYIVNDANIRLLFVGEQQQYNNAFKLSREIGDTLKKLVIFDKNVVRYPEDKTSVYFDEFMRLGDNAHAETTAKIRRNEAQDDDIAMIIYTSGTTGKSKGVVIAHSNLLEAMRIHDMRLPMVNDRDLSMCFLPLTHIFEKGWSFFCLFKGAQIAINQNPKKIQQALLEVRPTLMCNVPRFWEKFYAGVHERVSASPAMQKIFKNAMETGRQYILEYANKGIKPPAVLAARFHFYDKTVFSLLKKAVGLERGKILPVAGAPLSDEITRFLLSVNIPVVYGYGLSETTATVSCFHEQIKTGSVGQVMPDLQVRIEPGTNEILVKGKTVTKGYYKNPEETAKSFTEDGFFRTGDAGRLEGDTLFFLERIKDLFKTSNGKYIAPQAIEMSLGCSPYVEQCAVIADKRKFVSALIVPSLPALETYAKKKRLKCQSIKELFGKDETTKLFQSVIEDCQKTFASYEKIKRFTLLAEPFSIENGELTDTLKLKRPVIAQRYAREIEKMYEETDGIYL